MSQLIRVMVIPSWYPHPRAPIFGSFIQEQLRYLQADLPNLQLAVSLTGADEWTLKARFPRENIQILAEWGTQYLGKKRLLSSEPFLVLYDPVITWNPRLGLQGNQHQVLRQHYAHLQHLQKLWGVVDVIHAHVAYPAGCIARELSKITGIPYLLTEHNTEVSPEYHSILKEATQVIAVSKSHAQALMSQNARCIQVIPNPIDGDKFVLPTGRLSSDTVRFLSISRIDGRKGTDTLLKAFAVALKIEPNLLLLMGGDGVNKKEYMSLAEKIGISDRVEWLGPISREQIVSYYHQAHAFVLASQRETFGIVYAEALACGLPVIATRCGGPEEFITPILGKLVPVDDVRELAQAILEIAQQPWPTSSGILRREILKFCGRQTVSQQIWSLYQACKS